MRKIKVLFMIPTLKNGGAEKVLVNLVNNMDQDRFEVTVQTLFDEGVNKQFLLPHVKYRSFLKHQFRGNSHILAMFPAKFLYRIIVKYNYDIVVSYLEGPTTRILAGGGKNIKKVAWVHVELNDDKKFSVGFKSKSETLNAYQRYNEIICVSETVKDVFLKVSGIEYKNIRVLYNTNETQQILVKAKEQIDDVQFDAREVNLCTVGRLTEAKGFDRLLKVQKRLLTEGYNLHLRILGVGSQQEELENYISKNNMTKHVTFLGYKENPYKYVAASDLFICSSRREGFSTAVTESLIVGTPVVSTCCSGAYELLGKDNQYGIVVDNSEEGIYNGLKTILDDQELFKYYRMIAGERGKRFTTKETVKPVEELFEKIIREQM